MTLEAYSRNCDDTESDAPCVLSIAIFLHSLEAGGAQQRALALAGHFRRRGHRVTLLLVSAEGPLRPAVPAGVAVRALGTAVAGWPRFGRARRWRVRGVVVRLARALRRERFDVLLSAANHVNLAACWAHALAAVPGTALVLRISNHLSRAGRGRRFQRALMLAAARPGFRRADALIAVSHEVAVDAARALRIPADRVEVLANPVLNRILPAAAQQPVEHPWFHDASVPVILAVGRLAVQKDYPTLLRAVAAVCAMRPVRLVVLGDGPERARLLALAGQLGIAGAVDFAGHDPNPWRYMRRAGVTVLSSLWEGMPGALIEAMACGCPVVGTDCAGGSRELLDDGRLAPLVPVADPGALARAIVQALDTPPSAAALRAATRPYRIEDAGDAYLRVLRRCAEAVCPRPRPGCA